MEKKFIHCTDRSEVDPKSITQNKEQRVTKGKKHVLSSQWKDVSFDEI